MKDKISKGDEFQNKKQREIMAEIDAINATPCTCIEPKEHAAIVKKELGKRFPRIKFSVKSHYFSCGSSVNVTTDKNIGPVLRREISEFVDRFDGFRGDLMDGRYNVGFMYEGKRLVGASFCRFQ